MGALVLAACAPLSLETQPGAAATKPAASTATPDFGSYFTDLPPDKQTAEVGVALTNDAIIKITTPNTPRGIPPTYTAAPFETGIFPDSYGPLIPTFAVSSHWQGIVQGEEVVVYAGARKDPSLATPITDIGMVYVAVRSVTFAARNDMEYLAPGKTGALTIVAESKLRLTLEGSQGAKVFFDIPTRQFVDALDAKISAPTATPLSSPASDNQPPQGYPPIDAATPDPSKTSAP